MGSEYGDLTQAVGCETGPPAKLVAEVGKAAFGQVCQIDESCSPSGTKEGAWEAAVRGMSARHLGPVALGH